jgi:3-hydroxyacyl-CoA dehydrogenase
MSRFQVKQVAVLGAGVMGAQIAAHLVNVKVPVILFDLPAKEGPKNGIVSRAVDGLKKLKPAPLGLADDAALIRPGQLRRALEQLLQDCDLVIEAIAERMDWKLDLYQKIAPHLAPHAIVASNTSGLSITKLSEALPEAIKPRFCGIHFFNPPRYMALVELINTPTTEPAGARRPGDLRHQRPGQGRGARPRHAQLHRQPHRHRRHAGDDEAGRELRPDL